MAAFRIQLEVPDSYGLTEAQVKTILRNQLWFYAQSLNDETCDAMRTFNNDVKIFTSSNLKE